MCCKKVSNATRKTETINIIKEKQEHSRVGHIFFPTQIIKDNNKPRQDCILKFPQRRLAKKLEM